jgi:hypothetical protein
MPDGASETVRVDLALRQVGTNGKITGFGNLLYL